MLVRISITAAAALWCVAAMAQTVGFATLPPGSILHAQASVIAKVVQDNSKLQVRVIGYGGDRRSSTRSIRRRRISGCSTSASSAEARLGEGNWKGKAKPNLRTAHDAASASRWRSGCRRTRRSTRIADLKGKRVPSEWVQQTERDPPHERACLAAGGISLQRRGEGARGERGARGRRLQGGQARPALLRRRRAQGARSRRRGRRPAHPAG